MSLPHCTHMCVARVWRRRWAGVAVTIAATAFACALARRSLPDPGTVLRALTGARWWWLTLAVLLQVGAVLMYGVQQRRLLTAFGGAMTLGRAVGVSLARTALSTALPAGGPVSAAFAVRQFHAHGVTGAAALATTALASVQASVATLLVYLGWGVVAGLGHPHAAALPVAAAVLAAGCVTAAVAGRRRSAPPDVRPRPAAPPRRHEDRPRRAITRWGRAGVCLGADATRACGSLSRRDWLAAGGAAVARRLCDLTCLVAVAAAYRLDAGAVSIVGAYLAGLLVRQIPLAAGGAGLVEASVLASLVVAGADGVTAAAVVVVYRLVSCWLVALAGVPALIGQVPVVRGVPRRRSVPTAVPATPGVLGRWP